MGLGNTEMVRAIMSVYSGDSQAMAKLDMHEGIARVIMDRCIVKVTKEMTQSADGGDSHWYMPSSLEFFQMVSDTLRNSKHAERVNREIFLALIAEVPGRGKDKSTVLGRHVLFMGPSRLHNPV